MTELVLLNNYESSGIGDFGAQLRDNLTKRGSTVQYLETSPDRNWVLRFTPSIIRLPTHVLANIGLTSWGPHPSANFFGFLSLGLRSALGRRTTVCLHNVIESIDIGSSGYRLGQVGRWGAHEAVAALAQANLVVLSKTVSDKLESLYPIEVSLLSPIPCNPQPETDLGVVPLPIVIVPGYLSPYKGHSALPLIRNHVTAPSRFVVVGGPHRALQESRDYMVDLTKLTKSLQTAGIEMMGRLPNTEFDALLTRSRVGLLPYVATQGGSAMFARLASSNVPVVSPSLPEFEWLAELGAGLLLTESDPKAMAAGVQSLLEDENLYRKMRGRQQSFARRFSWDRFLDRLSPLIQ